MNICNTILSKTIWFEERKKFEIDFFDMLQPQRNVHEHSRYKSGVFFSKKCNRPVQYESGLELNFIEHLEQSKKVRFYWEQPCRIPYKRGKIVDKYTPDFGVYLATKEIILIEIKDLPGMVDHRVQTKIEGLIKFCARKGFGLLLTDGKHTIDKIKKADDHKELEKYILNVLDEGRTIRKRECRSILKQHRATQNELLKVILKNDLRYRTFTSEIRKVNHNRVFRHLFIEKRSYAELLNDMYPMLLKS